MVHKKTFSILIPVYNVEKYLIQCVESILAQDFNDFEIILINDGSTDDSLKICTNYKEKEARIIVIDKENGGASSARNEGIKSANGNYILFIDSDDFLESTNLLSEINKKIEQNNADVILYGGKNYNVITTKYAISRGNYNLEIINKFNFIETVNYLVINNLFPGSAWIFATKSEIIHKNELNFKTTIIAEDIDWSTKIFKNCSKIDAVNEVYYVYRKNQTNSVTGTAGLKGVTSIATIIEEWYPKLTREKSELNNFLLHNLGYYFFTSLVLFAAIAKEHKKELKARMNSNYEVTKYAKSKKLIYLRKLYSILGLNLTATLLSKMYYFKEKFD